MPELSNIDVFVDAVKSRQTKISRAIQRLWDERNTVADAIAIRNDLAATLLAPPGSVAATALMARGLTPAEIVHLDKWPTPGKDALRAALLTALAASPVPNVAFFWEFYADDASTTLVTSPPASTDVHIIFRSPMKNIRKGWATAGHVFVDPTP